MPPTLFGGNGRYDDLVLEGVRVLDPCEDIDECLTVTVERGIVTRLEPASPAREGLVLAPAFVDPHVHLRTPGREDEEDISSGTAAAAAGGYCAVLAMPNTEPVVDSAAVLGALAERAAQDAVVPVGFLAAITKGQAGAELTEMVELAERGAAGFTDDGKPVVSGSLMRRALQYGTVAGGLLALHEEDPALSRGGQMHEGAVSAELGLGGWPSVAESTMVARDVALAAYERAALHVMHVSARESVDELRRAQAVGVRASGEVTPHHLCLTDDDVRTLDPNVKMNPPLRAEGDRAALVDALRDGTLAAVATDHAPHARHEKDVPFEEAPFGVTGLETAFAALHTTLVRPGVLPLATLLERMSAGPARIFGLERPRVSVGATANLVLLDLAKTWTVDERRFRSRSANSWLLGRTLAGSVELTVANGRVAHRA
jgi:dihydroorotase